MFYIFLIASQLIMETQPWHNAWQRHRVALHLPKPCALQRTTGVQSSLSHSATGMQSGSSQLWGKIFSCWSDGYLWKLLPLDALFCGLSTAEQLKHEAPHKAVEVHSAVRNALIPQLLEMNSSHGLLWPMNCKQNP